MNKLIVKSRQQDPQIFELKFGTNRFGRSGLNDHPVDDPSISDQHCEVVVGDDSIFVRDLNSTNGTFIDNQPIKESPFQFGQTLQIGPLEMVLDAPLERLLIPQLPKPQPPAEVVTSETLADGYPSCMHHDARHAVWECPHCGRVYCDECVRKLRRIGGVFVRLCSACGNSCKLSAWSEMVKKRKKSMLRALADKVKSSFKRTTQMFAASPKEKSSAEKRSSGRH